MVRSKLRRFGSLALILVLLSALIVPTFIVSPAAITAEEFEEYCKYGVFADCSVSMSVRYTDPVGDDWKVTRSSLTPDFIRGGLYFASYWNLLREDVVADAGEPYIIIIDISFSVPFSFDQDVASFKVSGFTSKVEVFGSFYATDGTIISSYPISADSDGSPQFITPKFVFPDESAKLIDRLSILLDIDDLGAMTTCNNLFTTERFCVFSQLNNYGGYSAGYDQGYDVGYDQGYDEAARLVRDLYRGEYNRGYTKGYNEGAISSQTAAKDEGYRIGLSEGYDEGFLEGKLEGIAAGDYNLSFSSLFFSLFDAPVKVVSGLLDFNFLGLNMFQFACSVLTLILFVWLLKVLFL